jgi:hypothetical protein
MASNTVSSQRIARRRSQTRRKRGNIATWFTVRYWLCSNGYCAVLADNKKSSDGVLGAAIGGAVQVKDFLIETLLPWALGVMLGGAFVAWLFIRF